MVYVGNQTLLPGKLKTGVKCLFERTFPPRSTSERPVQVINSCTPMHIEYSRGDASRTRMCREPTMMGHLDVLRKIWGRRRRHRRGWTSWSPCHPLPSWSSTTPTSSRRPGPEGMRRARCWRRHEQCVTSTWEGLLRRGWLEGCTGRPAPPGSEDLGRISRSRSVGA